MNHECKWFILGLAVFLACLEYFVSIPFFHTYFSKTPKRQQSTVNYCYKKIVCIMSSKYTKTKFMRWNANSEDGRTLERMFRNREIDMKAKPSEVLHSLGWGGRYSSNSFCGVFNRMKSKMMDTRLIAPRNTESKMVDCLLCLFSDLHLTTVPVNSDDDDSLASDDTEDDDDDEMVGIPLADSKKSAIQAPPSLKKKLAFGSTTTCTPARSTRSISVVKPGQFVYSTPKAGITTASTSAYDCDNGKYLVLDGATDNGTPYSCAPLYWQWYFEDKDALGHICIQLCLPSGMCKENKLSGEVVPTVAPDGNSLTVRFVWPEFITNMTLLQLGLENEKMAQATMLSLVMAGKKELKALRKGLGGTSIHQSICTATVIPLKYEVETSIKKFIPISDHDSFGMCVVIILKVREVEVTELEKKVYNFKHVDTKRKGYYAEDSGLF
jgi:hypothetical protein